MRRLLIMMLGLGVLAIAALTLYTYRELPPRPFAADDYQWLLNVRGLGLRELLRTAFDPGAQTHFFRPLVWLLFWAQVRIFGLNPQGFHAVSLGLHLLNAGLIAWLAWRLVPKLRIENAELRGQNERLHSQFSILNSKTVALLVVMGFAALHPAPFEAVVWVSAQSELLAATLLLVMLHAWLPGREDTGARDTRHETRDARIHPQMTQIEFSILNSQFILPLVSSSPRLLVSSLALALALLTKESAVIGLALLALLPKREPRTKNQEPKTENHSALPTKHSILNSSFSIPTLITLAYLALQVVVERRNYLLAQGGYGFGPQLLLNPLRSLALLVAPLPGSEHADARWLVPAGALLALLLLALLARGPAGARRLVLALGITLLPTAPFASPPDSRYLYLPALVGSLLIASLLRRTKNQEPRTGPRLLVVGSWFLVLGSLVLALWAAGELHEREWRFAAAAGPGGSLWRLAGQVCTFPPERVVLIEPPIAPPHAEAIIALACGGATRTLIVGRDQAAGAIKGYTIVVGFPGGTATIEQE